jgi:uncharacterized membrane protein YgcG
MFSVWVGAMGLARVPAFVANLFVPFVSFVAKPFVALVAFVTFVTFVAPLSAQDSIPQLTEPVNDFAQVVDADSRRQIDALVRSLRQASGDVVVVATIRTFKPYGDLKEYALEMFENRGRGIGDKGKDNGLLVLLAVDDREVWVEVGYDLEQFITDGFSGETSRRYMIPEFRKGADRRTHCRATERDARRPATSTGSSGIW